MCDYSLHAVASRKGWRDAYNNVIFMWDPRACETAFCMGSPSRRSSPTPRSAPTPKLKRSALSWSELRPRSWHASWL
jgi:hypothetical protein